MPPTNFLAAFVNLDRLLAASAAKPDLLARLRKILAWVPLKTIDRSDERHVPQWHPEQLHQIQGQWVCRGPRTVEETERRFKSHCDDGLQHISIEE